MVRLAVTTMSPMPYSSQVIDGNQSYKILVEKIINLLYWKTNNNFFHEIDVTEDEDEDKDEDEQEYDFHHQRTFEWLCTKLKTHNFVSQTKKLGFLGFLNRFFIKKT